MFRSKKNHNRKWDQRPQLYRGRFFYVRQIVQGAVAVFAILSLVALFLFLRQAEAFKIHDIVVTGNLHHVSLDDVLSLSQIQKGQGIFSANLSDVQKNIMHHSWIESAQVRRDFPDKIQINIVERKPSAILIAQDLYLVDDVGSIFKKMEVSDDHDLPVMTGFDFEGLKKYPHIMRERVGACFKTLQLLVSQRFYQTQPISEINCDETLGYTVFAGDKGLEIFYGKGDVKPKQAKLEKFKLSKQYDEKKFMRLDLDSKNRVIARVANNF